MVELPPHVKKKSKKTVRLIGRASCGHRDSVITDLDSWEEEELELLLAMRKGPCNWCLRKGLGI